LDNRNYDDPKYKAWRENVFTRDRWVCQLCNVTKVPMQAHHIIRWAESEHLHFILTNGITLCIPCHQRVTGHEAEYQDRFQRTVIARINLAKRISKTKSEKRIGKHRKKQKVIELTFSPMVTMLNYRRGKSIVQPMGLTEASFLVEKLRRLEGGERNDEKVVDEDTL